MKTLVLVGGGHAHLHVLEQFGSSAPKNCRAVLISASRFQSYSGMFSGFAEGLYRLGDIRIDLQKLAEGCGVEFVEDAITGIDAHAKKLFGKDGTVYPYDIVSFNTGSLASVPDTAKAYVHPAKPNHLLPESLERLRDSVHPVIVGGGASGVELAFSLLAWRKQQKLSPGPLLLSSGSLLAGLGTAASKKAEAIAKRKALPFFTGVSAEAADERSVTDSSGRSFAQSGILWLTGPGSPPLFRLSGLPVDDRGFLLVSETLQSTGHPEIFGAGDCIAIGRYPELAKNGVYAVRQGPVLWHNLRGSLSSGELRKFKPQKRYLSILSTGEGEALLTYGDRALHGRLPWKLKQRIDRKFIKRFKRLYE